MDHGEYVTTYVCMLRNGRTNLIQWSSKTVFAILIMWTGMYECLNITEDQYPAGLLFDE
jgi:hypothetical protein